MPFGDDLLSEKMIGLKLERVSGKLLLSREEMAESLLMPKETIIPPREEMRLAVCSLLHCSRVLVLDPEYFFSDMPLEVAEMAEPAEIAEKLKWAECDKVKARVNALCMKKRLTLSSIGIPPSRFKKNEATGFPGITIGRLLHISQELGTDPRIILFGDGFQPMPYPVTVAMLDLLKENVDLRKMIYAQMSEKPRGGR